MSAEALTLARSSTRPAIVRLGDLLDVIRGASPRPKGDPKYFGGDIPWVMISDVTREPGKYLSRTRDTVTRAGAEKSRYLPAGTLILSNSGTVCVPKILAVDGCIHDGFVAFPSVPAHIDKSYLYWFFECIRPSIIEANRQGITQVNLNTGIVKDIRLPLVPLDDQRRIVAEIEKQFSRLDEAVANLKRAKANLKRFKNAVLEAAVEGRLVPTEAELARQGRAYETGAQLVARILETRRVRWTGRGKYKEPLGAETSNLPNLPEGWVWATVEALSMRVSDGVHKKPTYVPAGVPFVTVKNLTAGDGISFEELNYVSAEDHVEFCKRTNPERGDILISKDGTLGIVRLIDSDRPFSIFVSVALVKPVAMELSRFLVVALESPLVQRQMVPKGSGLQHIHLEDLRADCIPLPPLAEQRRIVAEVDRRLSIVREVEADADANLRRAERLRQSTLSAAFAKNAPQ